MCSVLNGYKKYLHQKVSNWAIWLLTIIDCFFCTIYLVFVNSSKWLPNTGRIKKRLPFWKRLIIMWVFSSNFQELSLTLPNFVTCLYFQCPMSGLYLAYYGWKIFKFRKLYKLHEYMPTFSCFLFLSDMMMFYSTIKTHIHCPFLPP